MYQPTVNDRVRWREHEGWVYTITEEYFTLEVATKLKEDNLLPIHKKHHVLILVFNNEYDNVVYLGHRQSQYDDTYTTV